MSFSSLSFFVFMIAVFLIYWGIPHKFRYILILVANIIFYGSFSIKCVPILLLEGVLAYLFGLLFDKDNGKKKLLLFSGVFTLVLGLLVFKYLNFSIYAVGKVLSVMSINVSEHTLKLLAPVGVSFYTFEAISYVVDVYKGNIPAEKNFIKLFTFLSFFPNITSGPIERYKSFASKLSSEKVFDYNTAVYGLRLILIGMVKKICGADLLKQYVDNVFMNVYAYKGPVFIVAIILYTYEIYLDFSGYTDMARGVAYLLGFELTENFKSPYLSNGIKEFFARWHISLSEWLRDYIYIPLGGSRCSKPRKYINLLITFLVSGIWHGANFTFIVWGILHGVYQCVADVIATIQNKVKENRIQNKNTENDALERIAEGKSVCLKKTLNIVVSFVLVSFAWMFFRANSLSDAKYIVLNMFSGDNFYGQLLMMGFLKVSSFISVIAIVILTIVYDFINEKMNVVKAVSNVKWPVRWLLYVSFGVLVIVLKSHIGAGAEFIYFNF